MNVEEYNMLLDILSEFKNFSAVDLTSKSTLYKKVFKFVVQNELVYSFRKEFEDINSVFFEYIESKYDNFLTDLCIKLFTNSKFCDIIYNKNEQYVV